MVAIIVLRYVDDDWVSALTQLPAGGAWVIEMLEGV
jgi:hypothetical protein